MLENDVHKHIDCPSDDFEQTLQVWSDPFCFKDIFYTTVSRTRLQLGNSLIYIIHIIFISSPL